MAKHPVSDGSSKAFSGRGGRRHLLEAIKSQTLIAGNLELSKEAINSGVVEEYESDELLMVQGAPENDIFLLMSGEVSVRVNRREVAVRTAGTHVGEMALVDPLAKRSATVVAVEPTITWRVPEYRFSIMASKYPDLWRRISVEIAKRLRERSKLLREPTRHTLRHFQSFNLIQYETEQEFERAVVAHVNDIFGERRKRSDGVLRPMLCWKEFRFPKFSRERVPCSRTLSPRDEAEKRHPRPLSRMN